MILKENKFIIKDFDMNTFKLDRRRAIYNLMNSVDPRRVIYLIDPELNPKLHEEILKKLAG
jgi:hypothetical protein